MLPLCFVLIPFGRKTIASGATVDFDAVYQDLIAPAVAASGMEPLRADEEVAGGVIDNAMLERLILCDFAVADLTGANANVFFELGMRHGIRPATTVLLLARAEHMPIDVAPLPAMPYRIGADGNPADVDKVRVGLRKLLEAAKAGQGERSVDSPVFQLLDGYAAPDIARLKTDVFRDRAHYAVEVRNRLAAARRAGKDALHEAAATLGEVGHLEAGVVVDLYLSYRAVSDWQAMVDLAGRMPAPLARSVMVREQLGFALNRLKRRDEAEQVLLDVIHERGPSSETNGLLGRIYKDRWEEARDAGEAVNAAVWLAKAIDAYLEGFEADWRDAYPGINPVTLMELGNPPDPRRLKLLPVVSYAVERRLAQRTPDYWDHATRLELAVMNKDQAAATEAAADALAAVRESWEPETTARNLALIRTARAARNEHYAWASTIEEALVRRARG